MGIKLDNAFKGVSRSAECVLNVQNIGVHVVTILTKSEPTRLGLPAVTKKHPSAVRNNLKIARTLGLPFGQVRLELLVMSTATFIKNPLSFLICFHLSTEFRASLVKSPTTTASYTLEIVFLPLYYVGLTACEPKLFFPSLCSPVLSSPPGIYS